MTRWLECFIEDMLYQFKEGDSFISWYKMLIFLRLRGSVGSPEFINIVKENFASENSFLLVTR